MSDNDTGAALGHQGIDLIPLSGVQLTGHILGYNVTVQPTSKCSNTDGCDMKVTIVLTREPSVCVVAITILFVNCEHPSCLAIAGEFNEIAFLK
jgi:hypothetical protein